MPKEPDPLETATDSPHEGAPPAGNPEVPESPESPPIAERFRAEFSPPAHDRRQFTVFQVDDFVFHPTPTKTAHWAVPWSDLMMTMFILFLTMFVYQTEHKQLLVSEETEVVGGETTGALDTAPEKSATLPFAPIKPGLPLITAGTIKKVVPIHIQDIEKNTPFVNDGSGAQKERIQKSLEREGAGGPVQKAAEQPSAAAGEKLTGPEMELLTDQGSAEPASIPADQARTPADERTGNLLDRMKDTVSRYGLDKYAAVDLASGTQVRITLKSDLLFAAEKADLLANAKGPLQKLAAAIKDTPFTIDVVGHTDNQALRSDRFPSNWELSAARASSIARFFIEETDLSPDRFSISGFSSYRPRFANTTAQNRAANRRIEVILNTASLQPAHPEKISTPGLR